MLSVEELPAESLFFLKEHGSFSEFAKLRLNKSQDFWNNLLRTDETKVEPFGHHAPRHI